MPDIRLALAAEIRSRTEQLNRLRDALAELERGAPKRRRLAPASRPAGRQVNGHRAARPLNAELYNETIGIVRTAPAPLKKKEIRNVLAGRKLATNSVDYHLIRALRFGHVRQRGSRYTKGPTHAPDRTV